MNAPRREKLSHRPYPGSVHQASRLSEATHASPSNYSWAHRKPPRDATVMTIFARHPLHQLPTRLPAAIAVKAVGPSTMEFRQVGHSKAIWLSCLFLFNTVSGGSLDSMLSVRAWPGHLRMNREESYVGRCTESRCGLGVIPFGQMAGCVAWHPVRSVFRPTSARAASPARGQPAGPRSWWCAGSWHACTVFSHGVDIPNRRVRRDPGEGRRDTLEARSSGLRLAPSPGAPRSNGILRRRRRPRVDKREQGHRPRGSHHLPSEGIGMRFVGIDVGAERHVVASVDAVGAVLLKPTGFSEDAAG